jgi:hypothetical protein
LKNQREPAFKNDEFLRPIVLDLTQLLGLSEFVAASENDDQVGVADVGRFLSKVGEGVLPTA